jgi:molybdate transport system ATP-binding protein
MLAVEVEKRLGDFCLDVSFKTQSGVTAVFGPSGAGKTTLSARIDVPPNRRNIGYVFQEGRLFPHLSVQQNLDYGRRMRRLAPDAAELARIIAFLDNGHLVERRPGKLSGGERQRVAIGRALLMRPRLLLLDEPLASLDAARKREILPYLERLRDEAGVPMVYVSHQAAELRRMATSVVRLDAGRIDAVGGSELLDRVDADAVV